MTTVTPYGSCLIDNGAGTLSFAEYPQSLNLSLSGAAADAQWDGLC